MIVEFFFEANANLTLYTNTLNSLRIRKQLEEKLSPNWKGYPALNAILSRKTLVGNLSYGHNDQGVDPFIDSVDLKKV